MDTKVTNPNEILQPIKAKIAGLKRSRRYVDWNGAEAFARELAALLGDIETTVTDPKIGVSLVAAFLETDDAVLGNCDDSDGNIGDVYRFDAKDLFVAFANRCPEKEWVGTVLFRLLSEDAYGIRADALDQAAGFLPEPVMRSMAEQFWRLAESDTEEIKKRRWLSLITTLACQLKDPKLLEKAEVASGPTITTSSCVAIAKAYYEAGDAPTALAWLERIPKNDPFQADLLDELFLKVYAKLGNQKERAAVAWRIFRRYRDENTLVKLLEVIGTGERAYVVDGETKLILQNEEFRASDAAFLIAHGRIEDAEAYLLVRAERLNGDDYPGLLALADAFEKDNRMATASVIYRAILESIMKRAIAKYYLYAVRYLKKLDKLAVSVKDWRGAKPHAEYLEEFRQAHARKTSFWTRYGKSNPSGKALRRVGE